MLMYSERIQTITQTEATVTESFGINSQEMYNKIEGESKQLAKWGMDTDGWVEQKYDHGTL